MILGIAVAAILLTAILVLSVRIQEVTVSGSSRYSAKQVEELLFSGRLGKNSAIAYVKDRFQPHRQIPFVEYSMAPLRQRSLFMTRALWATFPI